MLNDDFAATLLADYGQSYSVTRRGAATLVKGISHPGPTTTHAIVASVQPASGRDLLRLPEGRRTTETRMLYTITELLTGGEANEADLVTVDGALWEVQHVETFPGHFAAVIQAAS